MSGHPAIKACPPWSEGNGPTEVTPRELAPRETVTYHCAGPPNGKGKCPHTPFSRPYAADTKPQPAVDCRCGGVARRDGAPPDSQPETPKYGQLPWGTKKDADAQGVSPMAQLRKRRSEKEGARLLAERLAQVREKGVAR